MMIEVIIVAVLLMTFSFTAAVWHRYWRDIRTQELQLRYFEAYWKGWKDCEDLKREENETECEQK